MALLGFGCGWPSPIPVNEKAGKVYLSKPAPGFVGELARVVADEIVPEAAVRLHEPLAGVDDAMIRPPPLLLPGIAAQPQLLLELAFQSIAPAVVVSNAEHLLHGHEPKNLQAQGNGGPQPYGKNKGRGKNLNNGRRKTTWRIPTNLIIALM
uniref:Uncharacterized protein n=1 Tax=Oryza nivara TaxID=4536 RepID=A0A0E0G8B8_ORYNI